MWDTAARDLWQAARGLARSAGFTATAVATLAIGIGATTAVFSVVDGVLLKPLPYPEPDELVAVWHDAPGAPGLTAVAGGLQLSPSMLATFQDENTSFEKIGLWIVIRQNVTGLAEPEQVSGVSVTGQTLEALGVPPLLGRWIGLEDEPPTAPRVVMLSYGYWQERFGGDPGIVGRTIELGGVVNAEIVGVMPRGFKLGDVAPDLIQPFPIDRANLIPPPFCCNGIARLRDGVTLEQANADIERMLPIWVERFPFPRAEGPTASEVYLDGWGVTPALRPFKDDVIGGVRDVLWVVMAMIGIVLLIASANVANLLLVRGESRATELDVRAALGAGSWRIARSLLAESALLAALGGLVGVVVAFAALQFLLMLAPERLPRLDEIALDGRSLGFALLVALVAGAIFSAAPLLRAVRTRLSTTLRASRGTSAGRAQHRAQNALVVGQVALALVLLVSSGLMLRTFEALRAVEPGFADPETLQTFRIGVPPQLVPDAQAVWRLQQNIASAIEAMPGVESVGFTNALPMEGIVTNWDGILVEGQDNALGGLALRIFNSASPGYLRTMGMSLIAGRDFSFEDVDGLRPVAMVSTLAGSPALLRQIEQAVWSVSPDLPVASLQTMQNIYDRSLGRTSFTLLMLMAAAASALVLGVVGLYGVLSYAVSTRRREIAIRFALGAKARDVQGRIVRQGVVLAGAGVAIGLVAAAGVTRLMTSLLYDVGAVDPATYSAVAAGLIGVAALASYLPARRASAVDPAESLAAE